MQTIQKALINLNSKFNNTGTVACFLLAVNQVKCLTFLLVMSRIFLLIFIKTFTETLWSGIDFGKYDKRKQPNSAF